MRLDALWDARLSPDLPSQAPDLPGPWPLKKGPLVVRGKILSAERGGMYLNGMHIVPLAACNRRVLSRCTHSESPR